MTFIKKFWPFILCALLFWAGRLTAPDNSKALEAKYEAERKQDRKAISDLMAKDALKSAEFDRVRDQLRKDSLNFSVQLQANKRAYSALKKRYNEINLNRADSHLLDSIIMKLYGN